MKKHISALLALIISASVLASCATVSDTVSTSSGFTADLAWLESRLGEIPDNVTVGLADDFGIDMSAFNSDGYLIRTENGETVVCAKTADGMDRALRRYAQAYEKGETPDATYGEGYRVKSLTIAGRDISEYRVVMANSKDECHTYAADELVKYIEKACGAKLDICDDLGDHNIVIEQIAEDDPRRETLGDEGFTIEVRENGDLYITGGIYRGCIYGVYEFLEKYVGWRFYVEDTRKEGDGGFYFIDYLYESDHVDVPAGTSDTQNTTIVYREAARFANNENDLRLKCVFTTKYNAYNIMRPASHGIQYPFTAYVREMELDIVAASTQPCYTSEEFIGFCKEYYGNEIESKLKSGQKFGKEILGIDVAQCDNQDFCTCKTCKSYYKLDGSNVGPTLYFANVMADWIAEEYSPDLYVGMFAYFGNSHPPLKSVPRANVAVSYCFYQDVDKMFCHAHSLNGKDCIERTKRGNNSISNVRYASDFEGWCDICTRMCVWYYAGAWNQDALSFPVVKNIYDDIKYFYDNGVYGVYNCPSGCDLPSVFGVHSYEDVASYLMGKMMWKPDMTREEFEALFCEYCEIYYGSSEIYDFYKLNERWTRDDCWTTLWWSSLNNIFDFNVVENTFDEAVGLFGEALLKASCANEERRIAMFARHMYMTGLCATHSHWYLNGNEAEKAKYTAYYDDLNTILAKLPWRINIGMMLDDYASTVTELPPIEKNPGYLVATKDMKVFHQTEENMFNWWDYVAGDLREYAASRN